MLVAMLNDNNKVVGFADDVTASGNLEAFRWWDTLMQIGPNYRYYPQFTKSWLIVKQNKLEKPFGYLEDQIFKYPLKVNDIWEQ